jgi:PAS domain S-box-containing protein
MSIQDISPRDGAPAEIDELRTRLHEAEETLRALRSGQVDALTIETPAGTRVFSLQGVESHYRVMVEAMSEGAVTVAPDGTILYCNKRFADLAKAELQAVIGSNLLARFPDDDAAKITRALGKSTHGVSRVSATLLTSDSARVPVNVAMLSMLEGEVRSVVIVVTDMTEWQRAAERQERANRALRMLNACNTHLVRATDEVRMIADMCQAIVDVGGYRFAWVGYAEHDKTKSVRPVASAGDDGAYVQNAHVTWDDSERGRGPGGTAIRTGKLTIARDTQTEPDFEPWRRMAHDNGYRSCVALPLDHEAIGILSIYSARPDAFDEEELGLLIELADDLAFGITSLRAKQARERLAAIVEAAGEGVEGLDNAGIVTSWNRTAERIFGYSASEIIGRPAETLVPPEIAGEAKWLFDKVSRGDTVEQFETTRIAKDGRRIAVSLTYSPARNAAGEVVGVATLMRDDTLRRNAVEALQFRELSFRREAGKLRSILDSMAESVIVADKDGMIIEANPAACRLFGVDSVRARVGEWAGRSGLWAADCVTPLPAEANPLVRALEGEDTDEAELCVKRQDGSGSSVAVTARPIRADDQTISGGLVVLSDITERKRAEAELRERDQVFHTLTDAMPQIVWMCTKDGLCNYFSQQWVDYTGLTLEQSYGRGWDTPFHPDDKQAAWTAWNKAVRTGETHRIEARLQAADGRYQWFLIKGLPLRDDAGHVNRWLGTCTDIDELKRVQETFFRSNAYNRSLIEASLDPMVTIAPDGKITDVNRATEAATGLSREALIGTDFSSYFTDPDTASAGYQQVLHAGAVRDYALELRCVDGTTMPVLYNASLYRNEAGEVAGIFAAARNITEQKRAAETIRLQAEQYAAILTASADGFWLVNADGEILDVSDTLCRMTGYTRDELLALQLSDIEATETPEEIEAHVKRISEAGFERFETRHRRKDGSIFDAEVSVVVWRGPGKIVAFVRDISARKAGEAELNGYRKHLEELVTARTADLAQANLALGDANHELEAFAYSVSHDLRAPLRAIDGFSQILVDDYGDKLDAEGRHVIEVVRDGTTKMGRLIDDILDFSRIGRKDLTKSDTDMTALVTEALRDLGSEMAHRSIELKVGTLPHVWGDPRMLQRVWSNLLDNAVKFTGKQPHALIEVGARIENGESIFFVKDNGAGFDMQYIDKLFGTFQRLHGAQEFPGTGIGLAIVKRIITKHGGRVWAEGKLDGGATVYFALPCAGPP